MKKVTKGEILLERLKGKKILVDPGHGGSDPGAVGTLKGEQIKGEQILEKDLTSMFAKSVKSYLELDGATVIMTRTTDTNVTINERWQMGRDNNVDAVISVHFNSGPPNAEGVETIISRRTRISAPARREHVSHRCPQRAEKHPGPEGRSPPGSRPRPSAF